MQIDTLTAVSPIDGRYAGKCRELGEIFSEYGLVKRRVLVECAWLEALCDAREIRECRALAAAERRALRGIAASFSLDDAVYFIDSLFTESTDISDEIKAILCPAHCHIDYVLIDPWDYYLKGFYTETFAKKLS